MKDAGRIALALLGPVVPALLLAALAFLLHASGWGRIAIYIGEIIGALLIIRWLGKRTPIETGLGMAFSWSNLTWSTCYLIVRVAAWLLLIPQLRIETNWGFLVVQAAFFLLLNAPGEEIHFRGLLFGTLKELKFPQPLLIAACVSSGLFALAHVMELTSSGWIWFFLFLSDGLALCAVRIKTGSVFWAALLHGMLNICTGLLFAGPKDAADSVVLTYIVAVVAIDVLFFIFVFSQEKRKARAVEQIREPQEALSGYGQ